MPNDLHVKYPLFLSDFNENRIFPTNFRKILKIQNVTKIYPEGAELFDADRQTDKMKLIVAFSNFTNGPKN
jgi:hypothetical protein